MLTPTPPDKDCPTPPTTPKRARAGRPALGLTRIMVSVLPETAASLRAIAKEHRVTLGRLVDNAFYEKKFSPQPTANQSLK